jgi:hypothetical protein
MRWLEAAALTCTLLAAALNVHAQEAPPPDLTRDLTLQDYINQIDATLPVFGGSMLNVPAGADWMASVDVATVASAVGDLPAPGLIDQLGPLVVARDATDTKVVKLDYSQGRIRWANKTRRFDYDTSPHTAVAEVNAQQTLVAVADALGIPASERAAIEVVTVIGSPVAPGGPEPIHERERLVSMSRVVNGFPIYGSMLRISVSNLGPAARLLVSWPRFIMPAGLTLLSRTEVVDFIAAAVWEAEFGAVVEMQITLAYYVIGLEYIPVAIVSFSDDVSGEVLVAPLVEGPTDSDHDGTPDATDNCPDRSNPTQDDLDGDGYGTPCDNCPELSNPGQVDSDGDAIGDVCQSPEGACELPSAACDVITPAACTAEAGIYLGDGTACGPEGVPGLWAWPLWATMGTILLLALLGLRMGSRHISGRGAL